MSDALRIGVLGDFDPDNYSHPATIQSLQHAAAKLNLTVESQWIPTPSLAGRDATTILESFDGIWASAGSPYRSFDGMLAGIKFAREHDRPFLGTCGGFQYALIELTRNLLGVQDADSAENNSASKNIIIYPVACAVANRAAGSPKLSGMIPEIRLRPGSYLHSFYSQEVIAEEFFCNFEVNPDFEYAPAEAGFLVSARGLAGEMRAIESPQHRFFIATLFQPQRSSKPGAAHPVVVAFVQAAAEWHGEKLDDSVLE
jgi:CTP synthase (UTP-ammonia lyase)